MTEEPFDGAIAIVTGSSSGTGRAIARMLSAAGATVVLVDRTAERLAAVAADRPVPSLVLAGDVSDAQFCADVAERTTSDYGGIDILVSNAGIYVPGDLAATDLSAVEQLVGVNVFGAMAVVRTVLPTMLEAGRGDIVMTSSVSGHEAIHWEPVYSRRRSTACRRSPMASGGNSPVAGVRIGAIAPGKALNELWGYDKNSDTSAEVDNGSGITDADVADAVHYMLTRPRHVTIHDLVLLPSAQEI